MLILSLTLRPKEQIDVDATYWKRSPDPSHLWEDGSKQPEHGVSHKTQSVADGTCVGVEYDTKY